MIENKTVDDVMQNEPMIPEFPESGEEQRAFFLGQTARLDWAELAPFFARGQVVSVAESIDLIDAAMAMATDDAPRLQAWMAEHSVAVLDTDRAKLWAEGSLALWAVVVTPWVLVQARSRSADLH